MVEDEWDQSNKVRGDGAGKDSRSLFGDFEESGTMGGAVGTWKSSFLEDVQLDEAVR